MGMLQTEHLYSISPSPGRDVSTQAQLVSASAHFLFLCARAGVYDFTWCTQFNSRFTHKHGMSLPEDGKMETRHNFKFQREKLDFDRISKLCIHVR